MKTRDVVIFSTAAVLCTVILSCALVFSAGLFSTATPPLGREAPSNSAEGLNGTKSIPGNSPPTFHYSSSPIGVGFNKEPITLDDIYRKEAESKRKEKSVQDVLNEAYTEPANKK
ncbi:MAG: hypothetical protein MUF18_08230 [Fimbriiglobus sp.]|nr:hypothetical protein [Fimbriiglobus sp.]